MKMICCSLVLFFCISSTRAYDVEKYYVLINKAELAICRNSQQAALRLYDQAFSQIKVPLGKDVFNAWLCAYEQNDTNRFKTYSIVLIKRGAFNTDSTHEGLFKRIKGDQNLITFSAIWKKLKGAYTSEVDTTYHN